MRSLCRTKTHVYKGYDSGASREGCSPQGSCGVAPRTSDSEQQYRDITHHTCKHHAAFLQTYRVRSGTTDHGSRYTSGHSTDPRAHLHSRPTTIEVLDMFSQNVAKQLFIPLNFPHVPLQHFPVFNLPSLTRFYRAQTRDDVAALPPCGQLHHVQPKRTLSQIPKVTIDLRFVGLD